MRLILLAISIRVLTNIQTFSDYLYFAGRDIFECLIMLILSKYINSKPIKDLLYMCIGLSLWNALKPLFVDVTKHDYFEYLGFVIGLVLIFYNKYAIKRKSN